MATITDANANDTRTAPDRRAIKDLNDLLGTIWRMKIEGDERAFIGKLLVVDRRVGPFFNI